MDMVYQSLPQLAFLLLQFFRGVFQRIVAVVAVQRHAEQLRTVGTAQEPVLAVNADFDRNQTGIRDGSGWQSIKVRDQIDRTILASAMRQSSL